MWGHLLQAVQFTLDHRGPRGLPRLGFSDWDDTMNLDHGSGKAESVWCGQQFCRAVLDLAEVCAALGKDGERLRFLDLHAGMVERLNACWDGDWYARAYDDQGLPVGVKSEAFHQVSLNPQAWAVLGEAGPRERLEQAMESAHERLNTPFGVRLLAPAYRAYRRAHPRHHHLPARRQGKRRHLLPRQRLGHRRCRPAGLGRPRLPVLPPGAAPGAQPTRIPTWPNPTSTARTSADPSTPNTAWAATPG